MRRGLLLVVMIVGCSPAQVGSGLDAAVDAGADAGNFYGVLQPGCPKHWLGFVLSNDSRCPKCAPNTPIGLLPDGGPHTQFNDPCAVVGLYCGYERTEEQTNGASYGAGCACTGSADGGSWTCGF